MEPGNGRIMKLGVMQWLNPDREGQRFQPNDGKSFDYAEYTDVCPTGGRRPLQPAIAENSHP